MRVRAIRGAITADKDDREEIVTVTTELLKNMISKNDVVNEDIIYIFFTSTKDLKGEFPAVAARELGLNQVPVICARELDIDGSLPLTIRIMMLVYTERPLERIQHVYLKDAVVLRTDLMEN